MAERPSESGRGGGRRRKVKWRPLADRSYTTGAPLRTSHEQVLSKFVRVIFFKLRQNGVRGHVASPRVCMTNY